MTRNQGTTCSCLLLIFGLAACGVGVRPGEGVRRLLHVAVVDRVPEGRGQVFRRNERLRIALAMQRALPHPVDGATPAAR